jgi:hypothetical protein
VSDLSKPARVIAGEIAVSLKNPRVVLEPVALAQDGGAGIEGCAIEGACRCDDGDSVAGAKRTRLMENVLRRVVRLQCQYAGSV